MTDCSRIFFYLEQKGFPPDLPSILEQTLKKSVKNGRARILMVDAQSVNNTDTAELKGYDSGKSICIKRYQSWMLDGLTAKDKRMISFPQE